jgi:hypothetical protein
MDITQEYLDIRMIQEHLDDIPDYNLPAEYSIRWHQPGDALARRLIWTLILLAG